MAGATPEGNRYGWRLHLLSVADADGRLLRHEYFEDDQHAMALARLHELGAEPPVGTAPENATTRLIARTLDLMNRGEWDELVAMQVAADGVVRFDRRRTVSAPTLSDSASFGANAVGIYEVFGTVRPETIAVRGERLALIRLHCGEAPAFTMEMLVVYELDDDGRIVREADFDDDDLDAALAELDERYIAGEGCDHEYLIRRSGDFRTAQRAGDLDALEDLVAADFRFLDHRPMGLPAADRAGYLGVMRASEEQTPGGWMIQRSLDVRGDVVLARTGRVGSTPDGLDYEWEQIAVMVWTAGLLRRVELFALADPALAQARFEELAHASRLTPYVDNRLVRIAVRSVWLGRFTDERPAFYRDDCVLDDRRPGVNAGTVHGAEDVRASIQSGVDVFGVLQIEWIAVRGDRLGLNRWAFVADGGFEAPGVSVIELDEHDLVARVTSFQESDLAKAIDHLEQRHVELRGDAITPQELTTAVGSRAFNARDWDALRQVYADDVRFVLHTPFRTEGGWDDYLAQLRVMVEQVPDVAVVFAKVTTRGRCGLSLLPFSATTPEGSRYSWSMVQVTRMGADGRIAEFELFDIEQWDDAVDRFEQWTAAAASTEPVDSRTPDPENTATHLVQHASRLLWTDFDAALEHFAPDVVGYARESGPTAGASAEEPARWLDVLTSLVTTYDDVRFEPLAVRGDRLALFRQEFVANGFVTPALLVVELDEHERISRLETFGDDDLASAVALLDSRRAELDRRHTDVLADESEPESEAADAGAADDAPDDEAGLAATALWSVLGRGELDLLERIVTPAVAFVDHLSDGLPSVHSAAALVKVFRRLFDLAPDTTFEAGDPVEAGPAAMLDVEQRSTAPSGTRFTWERVVVVGCAPDGRIDAIECFPADRRGEATARFEEWSKDASGSARTTDQGARVQIPETQYTRTRRRACGSRTRCSARGRRC